MTQTVAQGFRIENALLREAFLRAQVASGLTAYEVARRVGWWAKRRDPKTPQADASRVMRALGLRDDVTTHHGRKYCSRRQTVGYETALSLADAIGIDPVEIGA